MLVWRKNVDQQRYEIEYDVQSKLAVEEMDCVIVKLIVYKDPESFEVFDGLTWLLKDFQ